MNSVSQLIYLADILPRIGQLCGLLGAILGLISVFGLGILLIACKLDGKDVPRWQFFTFGASLFAAFVITVMMSLIPSRDTILMIAASEFTESAIASPSGQRLTGLAGRTVDVLEAFLNKTEAKLVAETPKVSN